MILRRIGDYADSYDATTHKITRRVGVMVFNGTEIWSAYDTGIENDYRFVTAIQTTHASASICSHLNTVIQATPTSVQPARPYIRINTLGTALTWYPENTSQTLEEFQQWLADQYTAGTPVTIWYPLATPVEENWSDTTYHNIYIPQGQQNTN